MKNNLLLVFIFSFLLPSDFMERFRVPIYTTTSVAYGYDSNFSRYSNSEIEDSYEDVSTMLGDLENFDSETFSPGIRVEYSPALLANHETRFLFDYKQKYFNESKEKTYEVIKTELGIHIGSYRWLKFGYRLLPKFNLKKYRDMDLLDAPYLSCNFLSEGVYLSFSFPIIKKGDRMKIKFSQTRYLYNENFTEYDLKVIEFLSYLNFRILKSNIGLSFAYSNASDLNSEKYFTTMQEQAYNRWYHQEKFGINFNRKINSSIINRYGFGISTSFRNYSAKSNIPGEVVPFYEADSPFHIDRNHIEINSSFWVEKKINKRIVTKFMFLYRKRDVDSPYQEIIDSKSFQKYEVVLNLTYDLDLNFLY